MTADSQRLEAALRLVRHGLFLLPLAPRSKKPLSQLLPLGRDRKRHWKPFAQRAATEVEVMNWFNRYPDLNIGVITGHLGGVCVADCDKWEPTLNPTWTAQASRGPHAYYALRSELRSLSTSYGDLKADIGYVLAPPSIHPSGWEYVWREGRAPWEIGLAELPPHLLERKEQEKPSECKPTIETRNGTIPRPVGEAEKSALVVDGFVEKARDLYVAQRVMGLHGVFPEALGEMFLCPVPGHDETTFDPSAVLWQCEKGYIVMQCFHDKQTWTLPELYFAYKRGEFRELAPGVEAVWWLRSLDDLGITPLPKQPTVLLPEDAPKFTQEIYDGFVYLERLRDRARPDQRGHPYSWEFALDWCGLDLSESSMRRRMGYLLKHRYLRVTKKAGARSSEETTLTLFRTRQ